MTRPPARPAASRSAPATGPAERRIAALAAALAAAALAPAAPLAAQASFELPPATPTPTPAPAGPADERAGVAIPPRAAPSATPTIAPTPPPLRLPPPVAPPVRRAQPAERPAPEPRTAPAPGPAPALTPAPGPAAVPEATPGPSAPSASPSGATPPLAGAPAEAGGAAQGGADGAAAEGAWPAPLPEWWPYAAGGLGLLALLGAGALLRRPRKPKVLRLAAPGEGTAAAAAATEPARLDLTLEITAATRSVMMFTLEYRLTIANRSAGAVRDCNAAVQLACARATSGGAASAGAAQGLENIARIGPHQARSIAGRVQLPLSAIAPLRQGQTPLFIPLVHVTLEAEGLPARTSTFVIGTPSQSGRVHPIALDQPPGGIAGLVAQAVSVPAAGAAV